MKGQRVENFKTWLLRHRCLVGVADGVRCTSLIREKQRYIDIKSELAKFSSKCDSGLTRFDGKVYLIIYCIEDMVR